ncbi:MAG TPA: ceramidase domain-containing protein [Blastocatellia bacterium]|nr:ceramidase domain-containing protein [Blastocatellia bacterium]
METYRGFWVWGIGITLILGAFMVFVLAGWPGEANGCIKPAGRQPDSCYCEQFDRAAILRNDGGVRQPVNTWFNLYSIFTSLLVAYFVYLDRARAKTLNPIRSMSWIPDLYIFAVLFLGLGSMWFHASLKEWGGILDEMSMFVYAAFLIFYSIRRLWNSDLFFWLGYLATVALFTILGAVWQWEFKSLILILILVAAYLTFEVILWVRSGKVMQGKALTKALWLLAVAAIVAATIFWALSQTDGPMCDPKSAFQPHGLLWHPLAGVMAVLLYFYWREDEDAA